MPSSSRRSPWCSALPLSYNPLTGMRVLSEPAPFLGPTREAAHGLEIRASLGKVRAMERSKPVYVLVHGAWHGGWCWNRALCTRRHSHRARQLRASHQPEPKTRTKTVESTRCLLGQHAGNASPVKIDPAILAAIDVARQVGQAHRVHLLDPVVAETPSLPAGCGHSQYPLPAMTA